MKNHLLESFTDGVATLTMNRPDSLNALSDEMLNSMLTALTRIASDDEVGCVILTGAGRGFCAGGDVKSMAEGKELVAPTFEGKVAKLRHAMETSRLLHEMAKPTIAMMRGPAAGAGLSLALACDMRISSDTLKMVTAFANVGYSGDFGGSWYLSKMVGTAKAREMYYLAPVLTANDAFDLNVVNRVFADDVLENETLAIAKKLANGPRVALSYMKKNMNAAETGNFHAQLDLEAIHHSRSGMTEDHKEAAIAFVEKRTPVFRGR